MLYISLIIKQLLCHKMRCPSGRVALDKLVLPQLPDQGPCCWVIQSDGLSLSKATLLMGTLNVSYPCLGLLLLLQLDDFVCVLLDCGAFIHTQLSPLWLKYFKF